MLTESIGRALPQCPICLDEISPREEWMHQEEGGAQHPFHLHCMQDFAERTELLSCPTCKRAIASPPQRWQQRIKNFFSVPKICQYTFPIFLSFSGTFLGGFWMARHSNYTVIGAIGLLSGFAMAKWMADKMEVESPRGAMKARFYIISLVILDLFIAFPLGSVLGQL